MKLFISYSRKDSAVAQQIALALRGGGNDVFIDTASLKPTSEYHARIRQAIGECDLFVFLLSPNSVAPRGYALSELKIAKNLWPQPWGRVLPVMVRKTNFKAIDPYLTSVTMLQPEGSIAADVAAEVARLVTSSEHAGPRECEIVSGLLTFLEDRRLLSDETGYQSHFPDHLRQSAADIRERTTAVLAQIPRTSPLAPILKKLQRGARDFQQATEGAMDGHRAGGGMTPHVPMGFPAYFEALAEYRNQIYSGMRDAAAHCGLMLRLQKRLRADITTCSHWRGVIVLGRRRMSNPSLEPTRYGRQRKPGLRQCTEYLRSGLRCLPPRAAELERCATRRTTK